VLVRTYLCLVLFSLFCIFVFCCGSSEDPNEDIMRFRCGGDYTPVFAHIFMNFFVKFF